MHILKIKKIKSYYEIILDEYYVCTVDFSPIQILRQLSAVGILVWKSSLLPSNEIIIVFELIPTKKKIDILVKDRSVFGTDIVINIDDKEIVRLEYEDENTLYCFERALLFLGIEYESLHI